MTVLHTLWLPILLSSVFVFVASSILHMALPWWHKGDYVKLPQEDKVLDSLRPLATPPGDYMAPQAANFAEMKSPEFAEKLRKGPVMVLTVLPNGMFDMRRSFSLWFLYLVVVSFLSGYVALHALPFGARGTVVFRIVGVTSFLGYTAALWQMSIWYRRSMGTTIRATVDGLIYASSMVMLDSARRKVPVPPQARWLLGLGIAATLAANVAHGLGHGPSGAVVAAWPALVGSYELLMVIIRSGQVPAGTVAGSKRSGAPGDGPLHEQAAEVFAGEVAAGRVLSVRTIRARLHVRQPRAQRVRAYLTALVNA